MHKTLLFLSILFSSIAVFGQSFISAKQFHGNDSQANADIAFDADGNMFTVCHFYDNLDTDPGPGVVNFNAAGSLDLAIIKLDINSDFVWSIQLSGTTFETASVLQTDADGNVFVFGYFNGTLDMNPTGATYNLVSSGSDDVFCGKYDNDGNFLWAVKIGGTGTEQNYGFDLDADGDPVIHGYFQNTIDFDPSAGTYNLTAAGSGSDFILKLNNAGDFLWAKKMDSFWGNTTLMDSDDNIYIAGQFFGTVDFDPGPGIANLSAEAFSADPVILKLDSEGSYLWAVKFSSSSNDQCTAIALDESDNKVIVVGFFEGSLDVNPGVAVSTLTSAGYIDGFIVKLNDWDGSLDWGRSIGGLGFQALYAVQADDSGNLHMTGVFEQTCDFDPSADTYNLSSAGSTDIFRLLFNADGEFVLAEKFGGTNGDWAHILELDNTGAEFICGYFDGNVDFDPGPGTYFLNSAFTGRDGFVAGYCTTYSIHDYVSICAGESYFAGGAWQTVPGDYYDYFEPLEGCDSTVITHLSFSNPIVNLGIDTGFCAGSSLILNAGNPGAEYNWNTGATTQTISVEIAGTYSVNIIDIFGCTASDEIVISEFLSPAVFLGNDTVICSGETLTLNAGNPGAEYLWSTGATTQTIEVSTTGIFTVQVTNAFNCSDVDAISITVNITPVVTLGIDTGFCSGENILLDAENPGMNYLWSNGSTTQTILITEEGEYSVVVSNISGCSDTDTIMIEEFPQPIVDLGSDIIMCSGELVMLNADNPGAEYLWNTGATTQTIEVDESGVFSVIVTNENNCSAIDNIEITVHPNPIIDFADSLEYCAGDFVLLDAENSAATYLWTTGETTQEIMVESTGTFGVIITNAFGCAAYDEVDVLFHPSPIVWLGEDTALCEGTALILDAGITTGTFLWNTGSTASEIVVVNLGTYWVNVIDAFGCSSSDTIEVIFNPLPATSIALDFETVCFIDTSYMLSGGLPDGGIFSGDGVVGDIFNPIIAGIGTHQITYTYIDENGCVGKSSAYVTVSVCQSIAVIHNEVSIHVYPNPSDNFLIISNVSLSVFNQYQIINITGGIAQAGYMHLTTGQQLHLDIHNLSAGIYMLFVTGDEHYAMQPIVVQK